MKIKNGFDWGVIAREIGSSWFWIKATAQKRQACHLKVKNSKIRMGLGCCWCLITLMMAGKQHRHPLNKVHYLSIWLLISLPHIASRFYFMRRFWRRPAKSRYDLRKPQRRPKESSRMEDKLSTCEGVGRVTSPEQGDACLVRDQIQEVQALLRCVSYLLLLTPFSLQLRQ